MLELKALADVSILEVFLGIIFALISIAVTAYLYKMKGNSYLVYGFASLAIWNIIEVVDEFFAKNMLREFMFNIVGRIILIISLVLLILGLKKFSGNEKIKKGTKRGIIALAVFLAVLSVFFLQAQNNNFITSFAISGEDDVDVNVDLFPLSREIMPGDDIRVSTRIDTDKDEEVDVTISYTITDNRGIPIFQKSKTLAVERTAQVSDNLLIHKSLDPGHYLVDVEVSYDGKRKSEKDTFTVVAEPVEVEFGNREAILLLVVLIMLIIFFILLWLQNRKVKRILKDHEKYDIEHVMK